MYIERIELENIRTFTGGKPLIFINPDGDFRPPQAGKDTRLPRPVCPT